MMRWAGLVGGAEWRRAATASRVEQPVRRQGRQSVGSVIRYTANHLKLLERGIRGLPAFLESSRSVKIL